VLGEQMGAVRRLQFAIGRGHVKADLEDTPVQRVVHRLVEVAQVGDAHVKSAIEQDLPVGEQCRVQRDAGQAGDEPPIWGLEAGRF